MHPLVEFLLARIAEDRAAVQLLDEHLGARWVAQCDATRRIIDLIGVGLAEDGSLDGCEVLLVLARPYSRHPDFRAEWRR